MALAETAAERRTISQLPEIVESFDSRRRALFEAHYSIETGVAEVVDRVVV